MAEGSRFMERLVILKQSREPRRRFFQNDLGIPEPFGQILHDERTDRGAEGFYGKLRK